MSSKPTKTFKKGVKHQVTDEYYAPKYYRRLAKKAPTKEMRDTLNWIADQEDNHHKKLLVMNKKIKGMKK